MTRDEFLKELRIALQGRIPQSQVNEHLKYYENYIMEESRKGRTEEEVIADIGIISGADAIILNSVVNVNKVMPYPKDYTVINCYLDNDTVGRIALTELTAMYGSTVIDRSILYSDLHTILNIISITCKEEGFTRTFNTSFSVAPLLAPFYRHFYRHFTDNKPLFYRQFTVS